ncbi:membrane protein insertase YidC [Ornithinimicrobium ciconiae]|uniref:Membrane protein insertase YidC n=1 Tax=Ornithinimicrobium ciconiae TaxID=2594265 RepID=A0A516G6Z5_9MICO|nr:membrane protein insertase YidC [Ornithinimicrobium ciconiae]QDO87140.1 membrane protein insertase YidC [Ornithinimicrobium ciconiae]
MLDTLLWPFTWLVSSILAGFHWIFSALGMADSNGLTWALCIVGLVVVLRVMLMPLFVRQIHSQRRMQLIQPELMKIQKKYKGKKDDLSRQKMQEESFALYKKHGTNPFSSCLPIVAQMPFFFALFRILNTVPAIASGKKTVPGFFTQELAGAMNEATILGAKLSSSFLHSDDTSAKILSVVLIIAMSVTTFTTQHQLMRKNMPAAALDNPMARQQKILLYALPLIFAVTGVNFPLGVLIYWTVSNLWTMCQQFYVIRRMPAPGSPAEKALEQRRLAKGKPVTKMQLSSTTDEEESDEAGVGGGTGSAGAARSGQRVQPKSKKRKKGSNRPKGR